MKLSGNNRRKEKVVRPVNLLFAGQLLLRASRYFPKLLTDMFRRACVRHGHIKSYCSTVAQRASRPLAKYPPKVGEPAAPSSET
ncbi:hypothetical protein ACFSHR_14005 [Azotobacter chroococcum]